MFKEQDIFLDAFKTVVKLSSKEEKQKIIEAFGEAVDRKSNNFYAHKYGADIKWKYPKDKRPTRSGWVIIRLVFNDCIVAFEKHFWNPKKEDLINQWQSNIFAGWTNCTKKLEKRLL